MTKIIEGNTIEDIFKVQELFLEYSSTLGFDLDFQDFKKELDELLGEYARPDGCILISQHESEISGCVAMRKIENGICEMKRLYVRKQFRGKGIGKELVLALIEHAINTGYKFMRLDTIPSMKEAIALYQSPGFYDIESYRFNPIEGAVFMELKLESN